MNSADAQSSTSTNGKRVGRHGRATRQRLLDEIEKRCLVEPYASITVAQIAGAAGTSSATFYHYFSDVPSAVAEVATAQLKDFEPVVELAREVGRRGGDIESCRALVHGYYDFWAQRTGLLESIIRSSAEEDPRIFRVLLNALVDFANGLRPAVHHTEALGASASLMMMMSHGAARRAAFARDGVPFESLVESQAWIIHLATTSPG